MHRFYSPEDLKIGSALLLSKEESTHLARVLRLEEGDAVQIFNGKGQVGLARIVQVSQSKSIVNMESLEPARAPFRVHLAFAISKSQALDFIVHRAIEVGVASLSPLVTQHSLASNYWNEERWQRVAVEVCKQCQSPYLPKFFPPMPLRDWLSQREKARVLFFCDEANRKANAPFLDSQTGADILVGAEGGWSQEERERIASLSPSFLGLGETRLRAETAALVSTILVKKLIGEIP